MEYIQDLLRKRAYHQPQQTAFIFLQDGETESDRLTYELLDRRARAIAATLQNLGFSGQRALLLYPSGLDFITAFFGCLNAGVVAVPVSPPRVNRPSERLQAIAEDAQATLLLTTTARLSDMMQDAQVSRLGNLHCMATDAIADTLAEVWKAPEVESNTLVFLQYTSGSTGTPKGVMVSHGNLLHQERMIQIAYDISEKTIGVGWLPLFHDMGLMGNVLQPVFSGIPCILMSPVAFLQKPVRWLQAISRYRATASAGPNFAYELCVQNITAEQRANLDLSSWEIAGNGAEPVRADTLDRFARTFKSCGFRQEAFYPCYGMAETTLFVTGGKKISPPVIRPFEEAALKCDQAIATGEMQTSSRKLVGCGQTWLDQKIVIADPASLTGCSAGHVGEIWVAGPSVAQGYWNRPAETEKTFHAYLSDTGEGPFLRTGDLGFLWNSELFVTGRLKDLIIIHGQNHYPQDIELTVERSHLALRSGCGAAFSVEDEGMERLVVAHEVERNYLRKLDVDEVVNAVRQAISQQHDLRVSAVLLLKPGSLPKTSSGKIQRHACRIGFVEKTLKTVGEWQQNAASIELQRASVEGNATKHIALQQQPQTAQTIQTWLINAIAQQLKVAPQAIDVREPFVRYGLDSVAAVGLSGQLEAWLGRRLSPTLTYDYPTIEALSQYLAEQPSSGQAVSHRDASHETAKEAIAVIGIGCRLPGASNPEAFWQLLREGVDAITEIPPSRWAADAFYDPTSTRPGTMNTRWGGFLEGIDQFDPQFFGISPREAESMDPQQRLLLEVTWEALENAGQPPDQLAGSRTGVFIGISTNDYSRLQFSHPSNLNAYSGTGNAFSIAANRISYVLDLHGPSWAVDTACSSSLVAVHQACQSLRHRECDMAIVGGVNLILSPELTVTFSQAQMTAPDGRCKTFDADADGYVRGEGCGVVVLKRFSDASRDGDSILGLIRGSAVNQNGRSNGLTAPNGLSQQAVIRQALKNAGVEPAKIGYVETHGTGTLLGDSIELNSLSEVLTSDRSSKQFCWIGSVKTNIGTLEAAAGIAGLLKVVLALQHEHIPPHLHLKKLNPHVSMENALLSIPTKIQKWSRGGESRLASVSAFGLGGTNACLVLEEGPVTAPDIADMERPMHLLTLSAKSDWALRELTQAYQIYLNVHREASLADVCFTANTGRAHFKYRFAIVAESRTQLITELEAFCAGRETAGSVNNRVSAQVSPRIAFLFTGQGSQYAGMGYQLYETQPRFRQTINRCDEILRPYLPTPLLEVLYAPGGKHLHENETIHTQTALFALEYALADLWQSWGIQPAVVIGHDVGEYVAACVAGVFSLEDGLKLVAEQTRLVQNLSQQKSRVEVLVDGAEAAAVIESMPEALEHVARDVSYAIPRISMVSSFTGDLVKEEVATPAYWCRHLWQSVKFTDAMNTLHQRGCSVFIEIGPNPALLEKMGRRCLPTAAPEIQIASLCQGQSDWQLLLQGLKELYLSGVTVDWSGFEQGYSRRRIGLPTYPWQRSRYWINNAEHKHSLAGVSSHESVHSSIIKLLHQGDVNQLTQHIKKASHLSEAQKELLPQLLEVLIEQHRRQLATASIEDWFYQLEWQLKQREPKSALGLMQAPEPGSWLIFADRQGVGQALSELLQEYDQHSFLVFAGDVYKAEKTRTYLINPALQADFERLFGELLANPKLPPLKGIVHLWSLGAPSSEELTTPALEQVQTLSCGSAIYLLQMLAKHAISPRLWFVSRGAVPAGHTHPLEVAQASLWGLAKVVALEHPQLYGGILDLAPQASSGEALKLLEEIWDSQGENLLALRDGQRYVARLMRSNQPKAQQAQAMTLESDATYLITGGLGTLGLHVARWMVEQGARHLVLTENYRVPNQAIKTLNELEQIGAEVLVAKADVVNQEDISWVLEHINASWPPLRGIVHAAGVLEDGMLLQQTKEQWIQVMAPKVIGAWNIHRSTQNLSLDFLVLFSSAVSMLGAPGQGSYAAANAFLDALAHHRRALGQPCLSINWGQWADGGMGAGPQTPLVQGLSLIAPEYGLQALQQVLEQNCAQVGVLPIDWSLFSQQLPAGMSLSLLSEVISSERLQIQTTQAFAQQQHKFLKQLEEATVRDREEALMVYVKEQVIKILRLTPSTQLDPKQLLNELGFDSLTSTELKNRFMSELGVDIPIKQLIQGISIEQLVELLVGHLTLSSLALSGPPSHDIGEHMEEITL